MYFLENVFKVTSITIVVSTVLIVGNVSIMVITSMVSMDISWAIFVMVSAFMVEIVFPFTIGLVLSGMMSIFINWSEVVVTMSLKMINNWAFMNRMVPFMDWMMFFMDWMVLCFFIFF